MLRKIFFCVGLLICIFGLTYGKDEAIKDAMKFDIRDFYLFDEVNLIQHLTLAPKIIVNFLKQLSAEEQIDFLNKFPLARQQKDPVQPHRYILEFPLPISEQLLMDTLTEINNSDIAEGIPAVLVDNVEAVAEGFVVETHTPLTPEMLGKHLKKFGEFSIRQITPERHAWVFIIDEVKPPLHLYPLINLIHSDAWVKSVRPKFRYLHQAIVSTLEVMPISGTVDEIRTVTLFLRVFDSEIKVRTDLLPQFGEGKFVPNPVPPPLFFFPTVGARESSQEFTDTRGKVLSFQWHFRLFAPGEWVIPPQTIAYERQGEQFTVSSFQVPFVVTSLVGNLSINDMPSPKLLSLSDNISDAPASEIAPTFPPHWFDALISRVLLVARMSYIFAIILGATGMILIVFWGARLLKKTIERESDIQTLVWTWQNACHRASENVSLESYKKLESILMHVLSLAFPNKLPAHPILKDVEEQVRDAFDNDHWDTLCGLYEELESVHARDFTPDKAVLDVVAEQLLGLIRYLMPMFDSRKGWPWKFLRLSRMEE